ncbi:MAG: hypothetical protein V1905_03545 [bacterium]
MKKRKETKQKMKVTYRQVEGVSKEEIDRRLSRAYAILFEATLRNWDKLKNGKMEENK